MLYRKTIEEATQEQIFQAVSLAVKDVIIDNWLLTQKQYEKDDPKIVYYLSMEFLMGRALGNNLINLCAYDEVKEALDELGFDLNVIEDQEPDPALGNGGLGRLAACFLDSLATLGYCAYGCGIRYHYGLFKQKIEDGYQVEVPDNWLKNGYPFELRRPEYAKEVKFGGYVDVEYDYATGRTHFVQKGYQSVLAVPYDMPIVGYNNKIVNTLRIWDAEPITDFRLDLFDKGEYHKAVEQENLAKNIVEVLYPNDNHYAGKELRLKQQYFFISASIQAAIAKFKKAHSNLHDLPKKVTFQLNDTHPTMTVAELMRILVDEENLSWDEAWDITTHTCAYTNHTIMAEALEKWPMELFSRLLPRIYQIVEEINKRYCAALIERFGNDPQKIRDMAIIADGQIRMAYLAIVGSHSVNGVAALHTEILKKQELKNFYEIYPEKFNNKTNGITQRRWLGHANKKLADLITKTIGNGWITELTELEKLLPYAEDENFRRRFMEIKKANKVALAKYIKETKGIDINPDSIFDIQVKRLHEYKRQLLNVLHIIALYQKLQDDPNAITQPHTFLFGAKAAPGYAVAKRIIRLINSLADQIDHDPICKDKLQVVFLENYRVSLAEQLMPASEVSQQISTAGKEASGTGNMKFMMNGALTIGTLDGANVEMHQQVGDENIFLFGLKAQEVSEKKQKGYRAYEYYMRDGVLKAVVDQLTQGYGDGVSYSDLANRLLFGANGGPADEYMLLADFQSYREAHERAGQAYRDPKRWNQMALLNIAKSGVFAADRSIREYAQNIWHVPTKKL